MAQQIQDFHSGALKPGLDSLPALAGLQVDFPMLDQRLVDFSLRLPTHYKLKGNKVLAFRLACGLTAGHARAGAAGLHPEVARPAFGPTPGLLR